MSPLPIRQIGWIAQPEIARAAQQVLPFLFGAAHLIDGVVDDLDGMELVKGDGGVGQVLGDALNEGWIMSMQTSSIASGSPPCVAGLPQVLGSPRHASIFRSVFDLGDCVAWILRLVKIGAEGEGRSVDVMEIHRPDHLGNIADLGLALDEMKRLLAALQREIVAAQVSDHAVRRPTCSRCGGGCRVKDYQEHVVATLFGRVTIRLPRFRCAACFGSESGIDWPSHCRSTPELDRLQAHLAYS